jgi:signal transduction histidine kinase
VDLNALLDEDLALAYHGMRAQDASFNTAIVKEYDQALPPVAVVPEDLGRVFLNIASNACWAVREKARTAGSAYAPVIRVRTADLGDRVEIRIRDNGPGMPAEVREKVFNPFFTTKPAGEGTGLGLSISYDVVVRQHGGELRVESEEGEWTEFIVRLRKGG